MTPPQKPEWLELADADSVPSQKKVSRFLPAFIAAAALAIVGVGAVATQISDEAPANVTEQIANVETSLSPEVIQPTSAVTTAASTPNVDKPAQVAPVLKTNPVAPKQPGISMLPKGGGDEDDEEDDDDEEDNDDEEDDD